jgi:hypothetical protein
MSPRYEPLVRAPSSPTTGQRFRAAGESRFSGASTSCCASRVVICGWESLRPGFRQEATIPVAHGFAQNGFRHEGLFSGSFVLYVNDRFALAGSGQGVHED